MSVLGVRLGGKVRDVSCDRPTRIRFLVSWTQAGGWGQGIPREEGGWMLVGQLSPALGGWARPCLLTGAGESCGPSSRGAQAEPPNPCLLSRVAVPGEPPSSVSVTPHTPSSVLIQWQVRAPASHGVGKNRSCDRVVSRHLPGPGSGWSGTEGTRQSGLHTVQGNGECTFQDGKRRTVVAGVMDSCPAH